MSAAIPTAIQPQSKPTPAQKLLARKMYVQGKGSAREVAIELNLSPETVRDWASDGKWAQLRLEFARRDLQALLGPDNPPQSPTTPPSNLLQLNPQVSNQTERLAKQLAQIEEDMDGAGADVLAKLSIAHDRLFRAWQILSGTPNPGSRKVRQERSPRSAGRALPGPMEAAPTAPAPAQTPVIDKPNL